MKKSIFALVGAALMLASGFVFTGCANEDEDDEATTATMTVNFTFSDFTVDTFTVKAYNGKTLDDGYQAITATVAADGKSASCTVSDEYRDDSGWLTLNVEAKKDGSVLDISFASNSNGESGAWFEFAEDSTLTITYKLTPEETAEEIYNAAYTGTGSYPETATVAASVFADKTITSLKIKASDYTATDNDAWWINVNSSASWDNQIVLVWDDTVSGYSKEITDATVIEAITTNGLFVVAGIGATCTLCVLYE